MEGIMGRTRVKICGLTRVEDVQAACALGADAIGLVFYPPSPRAVTIEQAQAALVNMPPFVTVTALFVSPSVDEVQSVLQALPSVGLLQFHGDESPEFCRSFGRAYIKAIPMRDNVDLLQEANRFSDAQGLLVDTYKPNVPGGSGESFDWYRVPHNLTKPIILAGGLTADNISAAIAQVKPFAVDVSGGVEAVKGIKDASKMKAFILSVQGSAI
jgi:phosphoribosylanthranilate isomerase